MKKETNKADKSQEVLKIDYTQWNSDGKGDEDGKNDVMTFTIRELEKIYTNEEVIYTQNFQEELLMVLITVFLFEKYKAIVGWSNFTCCLVGKDILTLPKQKSHFWLLFVIQYPKYL